MQRSSKDVRLILDWMSKVRPQIEGWIQAGVNREIDSIPLVGGPPRQLARWDQPALREESGAALVPEVKRTPEVVGRHEGVTPHMEADPVTAPEHFGALNLRVERVWGVDQLKKEVATLDVECRSKEQEVLVVPPEELGEHGELVHTSLVDTQDGQVSDRGWLQSGSRSKAPP